MSEIDYKTTLKKHLTSLMQQTDLTIEGIAEGAKLSSLTIRKILNRKTSASQITLNKIANFFNIKLEKLYSEKPIKLTKLDENPILRDFYDTYMSNNTYFHSRSKENVVAHFMKNELIFDEYLTVGRRAKDVANYIKITPKYRKNFDSKVIAKALERMFNQGLLEREDRTGKGAVFYYKVKNG